MPDQGEVMIVGVRVLFPELVDGEPDIGNGAVVLHAAADIFLAHFRHHRIVGFKIVLNAHDHVTGRSKRIGEERMLGILDRVAVG
jgi:hypothetical protein